MAEQDEVPTVIVSDDTGRMAYYAESGHIRATGPAGNHKPVDITIPETLFGAFLNALKADAQAVSNGLVKPTETPRIDADAAEYPINPPSA